LVEVYLRNLRGCNVGIIDGRDFFNYTVDMDSRVLIYVSSFIQIGSDINGGVHKETLGQHGDLISLLLFFQNKESMLKKETTA
jgi:hypothetical protein